MGAPPYCLSMIFSENRVHRASSAGQAFPDHARIFLIS
jgi:hypothetical protein